MNELIPVLQDLPVQILLHEPQDALEQGVERRLVRADRGDPDLGALEQVLVADLGGRDLELVADAGS